MSARVRMEFNRSEFVKLLFSDGVRKATEDLAEQVEQKAGGNEGDYAVKTRRATYGGSPRIMSQVFTDSDQARKSQAEDETLTKALYGG